MSRDMSRNAASFFALVFVILIGACFLFSLVMNNSMAIRIEELEFFKKQVEVKEKEAAFAVVYDAMGTSSTQGKFISVGPDTDWKKCTGGVIPIGWGFSIYMYDSEGEVIDQFGFDEYYIQPGDLVIAWYATEKDALNELNSLPRSPDILELPASYWNSQTGLAVAVKRLSGNSVGYGGWIR